MALVTRYILPSCQTLARLHCLFFFWLYPPLSAKPLFACCTVTACKIGFDCESYERFQLHIVKLCKKVGKSDWRLGCHAPTKQIHVPMHLFPTLQCSVQLVQGKFEVHIFLSGILRAYYITITDSRRHIFLRMTMQDFLFERYLFIGTKIHAK